MLPYAGMFPEIQVISSTFTLINIRLQYVFVYMCLLIVNRSGKLFL